MNIIALLVLLSLVVFGALAFGWRSWLQWRRTGSSGFRGISGRIGSAEWLGGVLLIVAFVLAAAAPAAVLLDWSEPWVEHGVMTGLGAGLFVVGAALTVLAQLEMGSSWRIGVDAAERTELIRTGPFRFSRNPIFTSMLAVLLGEALLLPTPLSLSAFLAALVGLELQVRLVEEPYLLRVHAQAYASYASRVGRFLPLVGRLEAHRAEETPSCR